MKAIQSTWNNFFKEIKIEETNSSPILFFNKEKTYQKIIGFGGAFTDAACSIFNILNEKQKKDVINAYFSSEGLNYNLGRLTIGSCDFARYSYTYSSKPDLSDYSISRDIKEILPFVNEAKKINDLTFMASPWSPPIMFKTTDSLYHGGNLNFDYASNYALYLTKYVLEMKKQNIDITYMSIQNEPQAVQTWESCIYSEEQEARLALILKDTLNNNELNDIKLLLWDHNRDIIKERVDNYYKVEGIDEAIDGFAYHWYDNYCSNNLSLVHESHKDKTLLFTEGCIELLNLNKDDPSSCIGSMANALRYGKNYILDLLNYSQGFIDWNLLLNEQGGPNHVGNFCEALIIYNRNTKELIYNPSYYIVKHFSHFINKGAKRIYTNEIDNILLVGLLNEDGSIILIIQNENEGKDITFEFENKTYKINVPNNSITTIRL